MNVSGPSVRKAAMVAERELSKCCNVMLFEVIHNGETSVRNNERKVVSHVA
jgi:hypothetical protein